MNFKPYLYFALPIALIAPTIAAGVPQEASCADLHRNQHLSQLQHGLRRR